MRLTEAEAMSNYSDLIEGLRRDRAALRAERDELREQIRGMADIGIRTEAELIALRSERDEAVRKYEERVRQHEEYIAFADEEITGLIEKKRMVLVSLDEAAALLREIVAWRVAIECVAPELGGVATTLSRIDAFLAKHKEQQ